MIGGSEDRGIGGSEDRGIGGSEDRGIGGSEDLTMEVKEETSKAVGSVFDPADLTAGRQSKESEEKNLRYSGSSLKVWLNPITNY
jgi:hypothetical protein